MAELIKEIGMQPEVLKRLYDRYTEGILEEELKQKELFLIGTGASLNACLQAKYAFMRHLHKNVTVIPAFEIEYYLPLLHADSLAAVVSQSGESYETRLTCDWLADRHIRFYAITNQPESYLAQKADKVFLLEAGNELGTSTKTQTGSVQQLYLMAAGAGKDALGEIKQIPDCLERTITAAKTYVSDFAGFFGNEKALYVTGLGMQEPTARQAALMLKEKVFLNAEGLSLAEFRHGPVEAVEAGTPVLMIAAGNENREKALLHADFLSGVCNAKVGLVTDCPDRRLGSYPNFPFVWNGREEFSHICATAPFQLLVEYMAGQRGYDIDGFKFIGKVLKKY